MSSDSLIWHDLECGSYAADLPLWEELAAAAEGTVLDLGCGAGRLALHLARLGHEVVGIDTDPQLVDTLNSRARQEGLPAVAKQGDAATLSLDRRFALIIAGMQFANLLPEAARRSCLASIRAHLAPGAIAALALLGEVDVGEPSSPPPLPDVSERDQWVYSSLPVGIDRVDGELVVRRLRQIVSPSGSLQEEPHTFRLFLVSPDRIEAEAREAGLVPAGRRQIEPTPDYVGSEVVLLEAV
jgi:SAM-dependent methyltransferase